MPDTGNVINPYTTSQGDGLNPSLGQGRGGELLVAEVHGPNFQAAMRTALFTFNVTAQTIPIVTATVTSVYSLYNPVGSTRYVELVDCDIAQVLATTVVNVYGLYANTPQVTAKGTFTTAATTVQNALLNTQAAGVVTAYTAFSHNATPTRWQIVGYNGAVTTTSNLISHYEFKGKAVIPPGNLVSLLASTAASTGSAVDVSMSWLETTF